MIKPCLLSTNDNPFDPFEQFDNWLQFDIEKQHYSCSLLARIAKFRDDMSEDERAQENERAIDEIIKHDFEDIYKKVVYQPESE